MGFSYKGAFFVLGLLAAACGERHTSPEATAVSGSRAQVFFAAIDRRIRATPAGDSCEFEEQACATIPDDPFEDSTFVFGTWTPWLTNFCYLREILADSGAVRTDQDPFARPVPLPNVAGRQLFLLKTAEMRHIVLLEFQQSRFRVTPMGRQSEWGTIEHQLFPHPEGDLLVLTNTFGYMGMGRGHTGQATTRLQVYDLSHDRWLLSAPVARSESEAGITDDVGDEVSPGQDLEISRYYRVADQGRTIVLGYYTAANELDRAKAAQDSLPTMPPALFESDDAPRRPEPWPPGTYHLIDGAYRRAPHQN